MKKLWGLIYPFFIYYIAAYLVNFIGMNVLYGGFLNDGKAVNQEMMLEWFYSHSLLFTMATAVICLPVFAYLYFRDKEELEENRELSVLQIQEDRTRMLKRNVLFWILAAVVSSAVSITWNQLISLAGLNNVFPAGEAVVESLYSPSIFLVVLGTGILVPITEEVFFRGLIYKRMRSMTGPLAAILASSLLFGIFHGNMLQGIYAVGCSLLFAFLFEVCQTIWIPVVSHCAMNLTSVFLTETGLFTDERLNSFPVSAAIAAVAVIGFAVILLMWKRAQRRAGSSEQ